MFINKIAKSLAGRGGMHKKCSYQNNPVKSLADCCSTTRQVLINAKTGKGVAIGVLEGIVRADGCTVVAAQWSEHCQLKSGTRGSICSNYVFVFLCFHLVPSNLHLFTAEARYSKTRR